MEFTEFIKDPKLLFLITICVVVIFVLVIHGYIFQKECVTIGKKSSSRVFLWIGFLSLGLILLKGTIIGIRFPRQLLKEYILIQAQYKINSEKFIQARKAAQKYLENKCRFKSKSSPVTIILIIGESATSRMMHCYGYKVPNTPFLSCQTNFQYSGKVILMHRSYALNSLTTEVLHQMLSNSDYTNKLKKGEGVLIYDICKILGIKSYTISNQLSLGSSIADLETATDETIFPYRYRRSNEVLLDKITPPDEIILPSFSKLLSRIDPNQYNLIVIHLFGSHFPFKNRLPKNYVSTLVRANLFDEEFEYTKTIEYTDHLLLQVVQIAESKIKTPYAICYVSDHGEDPSRKVLRGSQKPSNNIPEFFDIPCVFFLSQSFSRNFQEKERNLLINSSKTFINEHIFDALIELFNIEIFDTNITVPEKNIFSESYHQDIKCLKILNYTYPLQSLFPER